MTLHGDPRPSAHDGRPTTVPRVLAAVVAATFLLVGVLGFVPGVTTHVGDLTFADHHSRAELLGVFQVSVLHNLVHVAFGVVGLLLATRARTAIGYLIGGGVVYFGLFVYGVAIDHDSSANFVPVNDADNYLHLGLALGMIALGLVARARWMGSNANRVAL